ncbi:acyltransferase family protein [Solicola sp. PLA-1-18]|uniref:acyltransferase family protein n=1 Tax=Solicola sp. PLA-1-18 TaxID=3380532 RepID=UPI003B7DA9FD
MDDRTTVTVTDQAPPRRPARRLRRRSEPITPRGFRPDIEGLRAIAVLAVVVYHAGLGLPGGYVGVDVFFVISGFLITRQLTRSVGERGFRAIPTFYAHRVRRLLPAAVAVVLATVAAARVWAPPLQVRGIAMDGLFTTFYGLNYRLAVQGTDYQHLGVDASPLQHFWSLAVEEQFYVVWPLTIALVVVLGRRLAPGLLVAVTVAAVAVSSWFSVTVTQTSAPWAYFSLHTRAWELGLGELVALTAGLWATLPRRLAGLLAWVGLAAVVASAVLYTDATPFPGHAAWLPVGGAALVVAAGCGGRVGAERVLGEPLMQCLGRISYSWYLWHWPMLVLAPHVVGHDLSVLERGVVVWTSLVVALLSFFLVEEPARRAVMPDVRWAGFAVGMAAAVTAVVVLVVAVLPVALTGRGADSRLTALGGSDTGTSALTTALAAGLDTREAPANLTPRPDVAAQSLPPTSRNGCHAGFTSTERPACEYGDTTSARTVVLFGDSHAEQWLPALDVLGRQNGFKVVSWTKSACPVADLTVRDPALNRDYTECDTWRAETVAAIAAMQPRRVVVSQSENVASSSVSPKAFAAATVRTLDALRERSGARVEYVQDIPIPGSDLPGCVAANLDDVRACSFDRDDAYAYPARHAALLDAVPAAVESAADPADWFCTDDACPAVVGNVLVFRNDSHMTVPYSRWLAPQLQGLVPPKEG